MMIVLPYRPRPLQMKHRGRLSLEAGQGRKEKHFVGSMEYLKIWKKNGMWNKDDFLHSPYVPIISRWSLEYLLRRS